MNVSDVKYILKQLNVKPNKKLGQNFITDTSVLNKIISFSEVSKKDVILEVGTGLGALTERLSEIAERIYSIEIDFRLCSYLKKKFSSYSNVKIICDDILKVRLPNHNKVVSNIPYSITGPIFEKLFFNQHPPEGIILIEKSIAKRIIFKQDYKNFSRITITSNSFIDPTKLSDISRKSFYPIPEIDLSLIKVTPKKKIDPFLLPNKQREFFFKFVAGVMPYKNKNISNAIKLFLKNELKIKCDKNAIIQKLQSHGYTNNKTFSFKIEDFVNLSKIFYYINKKYK